MFNRFKMRIIAVLLICFFCFPVHAEEQKADEPHALSTEGAVLSSSDLILDLQAYHEKYFGRSFLHNEDIEVEKKGIDVMFAGNSESVVYASGSCVGGDELLVENNAAIKIRAQFPRAEEVGKVHFTSKAFGMSLTGGGVAANCGSIETEASGDSVILPATVKDGLPEARLESLSSGIWVTRSGKLPFDKEAGTLKSMSKAISEFTECLGLNLGEISVSAELGEHSAGADAIYHTQSKAYGIYCDDNSRGINAGRIKAKASGGIRLESCASPIQNEIKACGIFAGDGAEAINRGIINAEAYGDTLKDAPTGPKKPLLTDSVDLKKEWSDVETQAIGIYGGKLSTVRNAGNISVDAHGGTAGKEPAAGAYGLVAQSGSQIWNTGTIFVSASSTGTANAYGIVSSGDGELHSTGFIYTEAQSDAGKANAFAVHATEGCLTVKEYGVLIEEDPQVLEGIWSHSATGSFDLNDSTLYVHINEDTLFDTPYRIDSFVAGETNKVANVEGVFPEDIALVELNEKESVMLQYNPRMDPAMKAFNQTSHMVNQCVTIADQALVNMAWETNLFGKKAEEAPHPAEVLSGKTYGKWAEGMAKDTHNYLFLMPYATRTDGDGYDGRDYGLCGGVYHAWTPDTFAGFYAGVSRGNLDFDRARLQDRETDIANTVVGIQGLHRVTPNWSVRFSSAYFRSTHDLKDEDPRNLEKARYKSHGIFTRLAGSYAYRPTTNMIVEPEFGLRHEWMHQDAFSTENMSWMSTNYGELEENELYAEAAVSWRWQISKRYARILPRVRIFADQVVTDGKSSSTMEWDGHRKNMEEENRNPRVGAQVSANITDGNKSLVLGYTGQIENEIRQHRGWIEFQINF